MRPIDADALKDKVLKWLPSDPCGIAEKEYPAETDIVVSLMMEIDEAPTIEQPTWIPCSERLPEKDGFYLTTITDGEQIAVCKLPFVESEWKGNWFDDKVLAWMSLPSPWKGADDE